jgi:hypothetical protein
MKRIAAAKLGGTARSKGIAERIKAMVMHCTATAPQSKARRGKGHAWHGMAQHEQGQLRNGLLRHCNGMQRHRKAPK